MSADYRVSLADEAAATSDEAQAQGWSWVEAVLTIFIVTAAVLLVSFISVVSNL
jgi:hypothetical protein